MGWPRVYSDNVLQSFPFPFPFGPFLTGVLADPGGCELKE